VWRMCTHCLGQLLILTTTYLLPRSAPDWRKLYNSKREDQDGIWRNYMLNDEEFRLL
jgi:hypothetical protein